MTGRVEHMRHSTTRWLDRRMRFLLDRLDGLHMRDEDDLRPSWAVKRGHIERLRKEYKARQVVLVDDDPEAVIRCTRPGDLWITPHQWHLFPRLCFWPDTLIALDCDQTLADTPPCPDEDYEAWRLLVESRDWPAVPGAVRALRRVVAPETLPLARLRSWWAGVRGRVVRPGEPCPDQDEADTAAQVILTGRGR